MTDSTSDLLDDHRRHSLGDRAVPRRVFVMSVSREGHELGAAGAEPGAAHPARREAEQALADLEAAAVVVGEGRARADFADGARR